MWSLQIEIGIFSYFWNVDVFLDKVKKHGKVGPFAHEMTWQSNVSFFSLFVI